MKPQGGTKKAVASLFLSTMVVALMFGGCKKKSPAAVEPAPTAVNTAVVVPTSTRTNTAVAVPTFTLTPTGVPATNTYTSTATVFISATPTATAVAATFTATPTGTLACLPVPQATVFLGTAGNFVILAKSGVSTTGTTSVVGDIGVSPIDSTAITGFGLILDASGTFSTSSLVTGNLYAADYTPPTPSMLTTAISDMEIAFTDAAGRTCPDFTELGAGDISGLVLAPGLYKWGTGVLITTGVTLTGTATDVFIFQIAQDLTVADAAMVTLSGGLLAKNVFWQVSGQVTLGTTADFKGIVLSQTAIAMNTGAVMYGRALAQTAVTLDSNPITESN